MKATARRWILVAAIVIVALAVHAMPILLLRSRAHLLIVAGVAAIVVVVAWHFGLLARVLPRAHGQRRD